MIDYIVKKGILHRTFPEDYAMAEEILFNNEVIPFIVVSDGCSGGNRTEIGSMLLCQTALTEFKFLLNIFPDSPHFTEVLFQNITQSLKETVENLKLPWETMIATLRVAFIREGIIYTIEAGDGYQLGIKEGKTYYQKFEYELNAPFYPAYIVYNHQEEYKKNFPNNSLLVDISGASNTLRVPMDTVFYNEYPAKDFSCFGMASDGLASYLRTANGDKFSDVDLITQLTDIKGFQGQFMVRRFQKIDKELTKQGFENYDDISVAVLDVNACLERNKK
jgi:hypothetical protein